jgi:prophage maintenance system killer protein
MGITSYSHIIDFIVLNPALKKILDIKISIFHTSAVMKLLQHRYKLQEDVFRKQFKITSKLSKTMFSFSTPLLVPEKKILKSNAFLAHFGML